MNYKNSILDTIGNTPLVKLNSVVNDVPGLVLAKVETFNPGNSIKDRMALKMLEDAERNGDIKPGGTIIESTSGNTGMGLAIAGIIKGYKCIFTTSDKQSKEKMDLLRAFGSEVIVCPTAVAADDPRSYYSIAKKLSNEIPNSFWINQYDNLANSRAHYESTGPEIWEQTEGKITHLVVGVGTGGTISGTAKFLKEQNPNIKIWGIDTYGSVFKKYHETGKFDENEIYPYITEGIGEDILPKNVDFSLIDHFEKVTDRDGAVYTRKIAREEGIMVGYSAGSAVAGLIQLKDRLTEDDVVVIIFHDHGSRYVGKIFNDEWMKERGFLESNITVGEIIDSKENKALIHTDMEISLRNALEQMKRLDISQLPVLDKNEKIVGSITESVIIDYILNAKNSIETTKVKEIMAASFPIVKRDLTLHEISKVISESNPAIISKTASGKYQIITNYDIIQYL